MPSTTTLSTRTPAAARTAQTSSGWACTSSGEIQARTAPSTTTSGRNSAQTAIAVPTCCRRRATSASSVLSLVDWPWATTHFSASPGRPPAGVA